MQISPERMTSRDLKSLLSDLTKRLGGFSTRNGAMCRCPAHNDREPSLSIRVGSKALLFKCFAGCDTLDVMRELRLIDPRVMMATGGGYQDSSECDRQARLRERARDIWDQSGPLGGTLAEAYLASRGLGIETGALRFNPKTPLGGGRYVIYRPALITAVHEADRLVAVQRSFLDARTRALVCDIGNPRRLLGRPLGGAAMLAPVREVLGLAEGTETALSASRLLRIPVWAVLGNERLSHVTIPQGVGRLVILPDNDRGGRIGAARALEAYETDDRRVEIHWPPAGFNDWNDVLRAKLGVAVSAMA